MVLKIFLLFVACSAFAAAQDCGKFENFNKDDKSQVWPWTVQLHEKMTKEIVCVGTLISPQHVLIAAHCLWPKPYFKSLKDIQNVYVTIGKDSYDLMDVRTHSDWNFNYEKFDADMAIISLFNPVTVSNSVHPICLPVQNSGSLIVPGGVFAGISGVDRSSVRQQVDVEKNDVCYRYFPNKEGPRTFCANWGGENVMMSGCSSGAYYYQVDSAWYIHGIESESFVQKKECDVSKHSVFTNVGPYVDWIQKLVKRDTERQWKDVELKCTFTRNYEGLYGCEVENMNINSPNVRIASVSGTHQDRMSHNEVEYVWIKNSRITHLPRFDVPIFFPKLVKYLVTNSGLQFIDRDDFSGMRKLETLDLSNNDLQEIPEDAFYDLNDLVDFFFDNNKFKVLPELLLSHSRMFQRLKGSNNTLEVLEANFFKNNHALKILSLDNNHLSKIFVDFRPYKNLKKIDLLNNRCVNTNFNDWRHYKSIPIVQKEIEANCH